MYLGQLFRSFRPLHNPLGFGVADFVLLGVALAMSLAFVLRALFAPYLARIAGKTPIAMATLGGLAVLLRVLLLRTSPAPIAGGADDFSYVLLGDTLRHFRLANPMHPLHRFFEAVFVLQQPTYSSIYPLGQGLTLALGRILFGSFWAGVLLSVAALCALCYWMLRGWTSPHWAFIGGLLAIIEFGPLNQWTNSYWGGAVSGCAGCLAFGSLPRLETAIKRGDLVRQKRYAVLLGSGLALQFLTRPYECLLLAICVFLYWMLMMRDHCGRMNSVRLSGFIVAAICPALGLTLIQNKSVTGSWVTLPYMLSRYQYGVPTTFTWQPNPIPHRELTAEQELDYRAQAAIHGPGTDSFASYFERLGSRLRYVRFFVLAPLYLAALLVVPSLRHRRWQWVLLTFAVFVAGTNFYPYFYPHYIAALSSMFLLVVIRGFENGVRWRVAALTCAVCGAHFLFWYGLRLSGNNDLPPAIDYETWDYLNSGDPDGRRAVNNTLAHASGKQLIFVRYSPRHRFQEWIANAADIDDSKIVWARDLGEEDNKNLIRYFPARKCWLLEPDLRPPKLSIYQNAASPFESVH